MKSQRTTSLQAWNFEELREFLEPRVLVHEAGRRLFEKETATPANDKHEQQAHPWFTHEIYLYAVMVPCSHDS